MKNPFRILIIFGLFALPLCVQAELQNGKVEFGLIKGNALLVTPKAVKTPATQGYVFEQGYRVETMKESTTELLLSNGATLILEPNTSLEVRTFRQVGSDLIKAGEYRMLTKEPSPSVTEIVIKRGKITGEVRKLNPQSTFSIKTPVGVARIRGTIYTVEYAQNNAKAVGNINVSCVRGSVEVAINGSNTGPTPVAAGKQMAAQASVTVTPEEKTDVVKSTAAVSNSTTLPKAEGAPPLAVGAVISAPGVPEGTTVVGLDAGGNAILSNPVSISAGADLMVSTAAAPEPEPVVRSTVAVAVANTNKLPAAAGQSLAVGAEISGAGIPAGTKVTGVDSEGNVTLSNPVTISAGAEIAAVPTPAAVEPPPVITPTITVTRMNSEQVSAVASTLSSGSSMSADVVNAVKEIAKAAPPPAPVAPTTSTTTTSGVGGTTTESSSGTSTTAAGSTSTESSSGSSSTDSTSTSTSGSSSLGNTGSGGSTGNVLDNIIDTIQKVIEKQQQENPSPAGG